jgi:hypothetical protein
MSTVRQLVSDVRSEFKIISSDATISDRVIAEALRKVNIKYVVQRLDTRQGWTDPNLFTIFDCIPMQDVPITECCDVQINCKISRSVNKLPKIIGTKFNLAIEGVWSVDNPTKNTTRFKEGTANRYTNSLKLKKRTEDKFFWFKNGYLYLSVPSIELASLSAFTEQFVDPSEYSCTSDLIECKTNPLDLEFKTLKGLEEDVVLTVSQKLLSTYFNVNKDRTSDNIDEQSR